MSASQYLSKTKDLGARNTLSPKNPHKKKLLSIDLSLREFFLSWLETESSVKFTAKKHLPSYSPCFPKEEQFDMAWLHFSHDEDSRRNTASCLVAYYSLRGNIRACSNSEFISSGNNNVQKRNFVPNEKEWTVFQDLPQNKNFFSFLETLK